MNETNESGVDDLDRRIAERLVADGRESNYALATALGVTQQTIAARLRRLDANLLLRSIAVTDISAFGFEQYAFALIQTIDRSPLDVAADLVALPELISVNVTSGQFGVVARLMARSRGDLARLVQEAIPSVVGVAKVSCEWAVDVLHDVPRFTVLRQSGSRPWLEQGGLTPAWIRSASGLDEIDLRVIAQLQRNARTSNRQIASELNVSEGTVRSRIRRLLDEQFIRIQAVCDFRAFGQAIPAFVGVRASHGQAASVGERLATMAGVQFAVRTIGLFDFQLLVFAESQTALSNLLHGQIGRVPGVASVEALQISITCKHINTWAQIRGMTLRQSAPS